MGRPKLALPLGGRTVLQCVIAALRAGGADEVLVVIGPHVPGLEAPARAEGAHVLILPEETADMRATVEHGLRWLEAVFHPRPEERWLLAPADHPTLDSAIVRHLLQARAASATASIVVPTFQGKRGHPTLIDWKHVEPMRALPAGEGLNAYLRRCGEQTLELDVVSSEVLTDLDTPEDYERLCLRFAERERET
jgi:molybdenum cofactor cytidylyltransferase